VATCGTALAEEHFTLLRNFGRRIVLAYDADGAGQSATSRVYEWERRHEVDVVVADLPKGSDPGDLARSDPAALARAVAEARPFLQFRVDRLLSASDLTTAEGRARAAESALSAVAEHPDVLVRDQYVMQLSDRCRLDAPRLRERLEDLRAHPPAEPSTRHTRNEPASRNQPRGDPGEVREPDDYDAGDWEESGYVTEPVVQKAGPGLEALKLAVHRPEEVADRFQAVLFSDPLQRDAFDALVHHDDLHDAIASASPEVAGLLRRVTVEEPLAGDPAFGDPVDLVVRVLLNEAVRRELLEVEKASRGLGESWQAGAAVTAQVRHWLDELEDPGSVRGAADRLVAWLMQREPKEG
jgi:DNA primase